MAVDKLQVKIDAAIIHRRAGSPAIRETITVRDTHTEALLTNLWHDPFDDCVMCVPIQLAEDWRNNPDVTRYGKARWTLTSSHWDEVERDQDRFLLSDGTNERISTTHVFEANSGFLLQFTLLGEKDERFQALTLEFGQWTVIIDTDGFCTLKKGISIVATGYITSSARDSLIGGMRELLILPLGKKVGIRQNGVAGFTYELPEEDRIGDTIEAGDFALTAHNCAIRFQLTQLQYDPVALTYSYVSPQLTFPGAPAADQTISIHADDLATVSGTGVVLSVIKADLSGLFVPDGVETEYRVQCNMATTGKTTPYLRGIGIEVEPTSPATPDDPNNIIADVRSCTLLVDGRPENTEARLVVRNPDSYGFYGACNRFAVLKLGDFVLLSGILKEPPAYVYTDDGDQYYELTVQSIAKYLENPCLNSSVMFDGVAHTEAIRWLCLFANLSDADLDIAIDTTPLPNTRQQSGEGGVTSHLQPKYGDKPFDWIDNICKQSGWIFTDGHDGNDFVLIYMDPLELPTVAEHTFVLSSDDETVGADYPYERIYSWRAYSIEPEANEFYVFGCTPEGHRIAACYWDPDSQDPNLVEASRPDNWLGARRVAVFEYEGAVTVSHLETHAYRMGQDISQRRDYIAFEADWPKGLWANDVVRINAPTGSNIPGLDNDTALYRIEAVSVDFTDEAGDIPIRRGQYTAVRIGD